MKLLTDSVKKGVSLTIAMHSAASPVSVPLELAVGLAVYWIVFDWLVYSADPGEQGSKV